MIWMPFHDRVTYKICLMMCKVKTNLVPQYLQAVASVHTHNTRSAASSGLYTCNTQLFY